MNLEKVHEFLKSRLTCVVARVNTGGGASAATMGFWHDERLRFLVATRKSSRKHNDLKNNAKVAIVVGFEPPATVQYEGIAKEMTAEELGDRLNMLFEKVPGARKLAGDEDQTYFLISPTWMCYRNVIDESQTFETEQFS